MNAPKNELIIRGFEKQLRLLMRQARCPDDFGIFIALSEALKSVKAGNFGVGACLVDKAGRVVARGHNTVFSPRFRSDQHAEMAVLDRVEKLPANSHRPKDMTLYTSLECCPMCLTRVILSGIGKIRYAAEDEIGGMTEHRNLLPSVWRRLAAPQNFAQADCSPAHRQLASELFAFRLHELNDKLVRRAGYRISRT